jgi:AbrB family looped-hinge helix DNA binding protein
MTTATIGARYQVVLPKAERRRLGLKPHSKVNVEAREHCLLIWPVSGAGLRGLGRELAGKGDATDYVRKLRREWAGRR